MYEKLWYLFVAIGEGIVTLKPRIVKYASYKPNRMISAYGVHVILQYFVMHFDQAF